MKIKLNKLFKSGHINNIVKIIGVLISMSILFAIINYTNSLEQDSVEMFVHNYQTNILTTSDQNNLINELSKLQIQADTKLEDDKAQKAESDEKNRLAKEKDDEKIQEQLDNKEAVRRSELSTGDKHEEDINNLTDKLKNQQEKNELESKAHLEYKEVIDTTFAKLASSAEAQEAHRMSLSENDREIKNCNQDYTEHPGILSMGQNITDFTSSKTIPDASDGGCLNNINLTDSISKCDDASDCNSFYSYNPKGDGRVCFKNNSSSINKHINATDTRSSFFIKNYKKYPGTLQMGEFPKQFVDSKLGCQLLGFEDAKKMCNNANDCNSFFSYNGDNEGEGRVCFKNNSKPINTHKPDLDPKYKDKSAFFVKN
jgi:hypothetical protein